MHSLTWCLASTSAHGRYTPRPCGQQPSTRAVLRTGPSSGQKIAAKSPRMRTRRIPVVMGDGRRVRNRAERASGIKHESTKQSSALATVRGRRCGDRDRGVGGGGAIVSDFLGLTADPLDDSISRPLHAAQRPAISTQPEDQRFLQPRGRSYRSCDRCTRPQG